MITTRQLARIEPNETCDPGDPNTSQGGDSGGPIYQAIAGRTGYVRVFGIVEGGTHACETLFTKISGIRAWAPSATVPLG